MVVNMVVNIDWQCSKCKGNGCRYCQGLGYYRAPGYKTNMSKKMFKVRYLFYFLFGVVCGLIWNMYFYDVDPVKLEELKCLFTGPEK